MKKTFRYTERDFVESLYGWYEAKLRNKFEDGYTIWKDAVTGDWVGVKEER